MIRKISDLALLRNDEYGMPSVTDFPLIDAAVGPNFVFQVTISKSYAKAEEGQPILPISLLFLRTMH